METKQTKKLFSTFFHKILGFEAEFKYLNHDMRNLSSIALFSMLFQFHEFMNVKTFRKLNLLRSAAKGISATSDNYAQKLILQFDGGSRGNPGSGGSAAVLYSSDTQGKWEEIWHGFKYIGNSGVTNNVAEYQGLIEGLKQGVKMSIPSLVIQVKSFPHQFHLFPCLLTFKYLISNQKQCLFIFS
jgi:hypothetical protein